MRYLILTLIAIGFISQYCLPTAGLPRVLRHGEQRYDFVSTQKAALQVILYFNREIEQGEEDPDLTVYGYWLEDHRHYANFRWIGSIYGYADHYEFIDRAREGVYELWEWLRYYEVDYLVWDEFRMERGDGYFGEYGMPVEDPEWGGYFEVMPNHGTVKIWRVKR